MFTLWAQLPGSGPEVEAVSVTLSPLQTMPVGPDMLTEHWGNAVAIPINNVKISAKTFFIIMF
jgi:hypothetical protein